MSRVDKFEDLIAWQKARELTQVVYEMTRQEQFSRDFALVGQIRRAVISIMSNIAEGFERGGRSEFHQFLSTAKASCAEVRCQLYIAFDVGYIDNSLFSTTMEIAQECARVVGGLRAAVERQRDEQHKKS